MILSEIMSAQSLEISIDYERLPFRIGREEVTTNMPVRMHALVVPALLHSHYHQGTSVVTLLPQLAIVIAIESQTGVTRDIRDSPLMASVGRMRHALKLVRSFRRGTKLRFNPSCRSFASSTTVLSSDPRVNLTAPNARSWKQPVGLFINGRFVESQDGTRLTTINPSYVTFAPYAGRTQTVAYYQS